MKLLISLGCLLTIIYLEGCGDGMIKNKSTEQASVVTDTPKVKPKESVPNFTSNLIIHDDKDLIGYWVGMFKPDTLMDGVYTGEYTAWDFENKINISIDEINGDSVMGHSVVAGNNRPFKGKIIRDHSAFSFSVKEPGNDKYDGSFEFGINKTDSVLKGTWKANNKIRITSRKYKLTKKLFHYNPNWQLLQGKFVDWSKKKKVHFKNDEEGEDYDESFFTTSFNMNKYNASTDVLTKEQVANLKKADIFVIRNAIYARHGYSFKNQQLRAYFDRQSWYIPISTDVKSEFTEIEKKNIELLLRYEKNAKEYYDVFGRG